MKKAIYFAASLLLMTGGAVFAGYSASGNSAAVQADDDEYMSPPAGYNWLETPTQEGECYKLQKGTYMFQLIDVYKSIPNIPEDAKVSIMRDGEVIDQYQLTQYTDDGDIGTDLEWTLTKNYTEVGEYYMVLPFNGLKAILKDSDEEITLKDMKIGPWTIPYIEPVAAEISMTTPASELSSEELPTSASFTINAKACPQQVSVSRALSITNPEGNTVETTNAIQFSSTANTFSIPFPKDWYTEPGEYTITLDGTKLREIVAKDSSGDSFVWRTSDHAPLTFEDEYTYKFTVTDPYALPAEVRTVTPAPGEIESWGYDKVSILFNGAVKTGTFPDDATVTVTDPDGNKQNYDLIKNNAAQFYLEPDASFTKPGRYTITVDISKCTFRGADGEKNLEPFNIVYDVKAIAQPVAAVFTMTSPEAEVSSENLPKIAYFTLNTVTKWPKDMVVSKALTVTDPEGNTTVTSGAVQFSTYDNTFSIAFPKEWYTEPGDYTITLNAKTIIETVEANGATLRAESLGILTFEDEYTYKLTVTAPEVPEIPEVTIGSETISDNTYEIEDGKSVTVNLTVEGADVYYKWTATQAETQTINIAETTDFVQYTDPLEIDSAGTLEYFSQKGTQKSETRTLTFTVKEADPNTLPKEIQQIVPAPGTYTEWDYTTITFHISGQGMAATGSGTAKVTVTNPSGVEKSDFKWTASPTVYSFATDDFFNENGTYIVDVDFSALTWVSDNTDMTPAPKFSFKYILDAQTGVAYIEVDGEDAEYYDLNGHQVRGNLMPGIYVKSMNGKTMKVMVK